MVMVIAMMGSVLVFGFDQTLNRRKDAEAEELLAWLEASADTAVFQSTVIGVAQEEDQLILMAFYQNDWFRLADQTPLPLDGEMLITWSDSILENNEFQVADEDRLSPYLVLMPSGEILPEGQISVLDGDKIRAQIQWPESKEFSLSWQES